MIDRQGSADRHVRSIFVSDVHLGCRHARAEEFLAFLNRFEPENLYVVGDFIDGWKLRRRWRWSPIYNSIFKRLMQLSENGTRLFYTPGNHDAFLREFQLPLSFVSIADEFVHETANGRRFVVIHGDRFDKVEMEMRWLSMLATIGYEALLTTNAGVNRLMHRSRMQRYAFSAAVKSRVKTVVRYISEFEGQLQEHARTRGCHGVICGHTHCPHIDTLDDVVYCNTGDWVEHCTALIEHYDGRMELHYHEDLHLQQARRPEPRRRELPAVAVEAWPELVATL